MITRHTIISFIITITPVTSTTIYQLQFDNEYCLVSSYPISTSVTFQNCHRHSDFWKWENNQVIKHVRSNLCLTRTSDKSLELKKCYKNNIKAQKRLGYHVLSQHWRLSSKGHVSTLSKQKNNRAIQRKFLKIDFSNKEGGYIKLSTKEASSLTKFEKVEIENSTTKADENDVGGAGFLFTVLVVMWIVMILLVAGVIVLNVVV